MATTSKIEWTQQTWNPATGCTKVSAGCKNCYAEQLARRLQKMGAPGYENGFELSLMPCRLKQPLARRKPTTYFVNSMSDLFHEGIPFSYLDQVFAVMRETPQHSYQVLTKRAALMRRYFAKREVPNNVWLGVTVENKKHGLPRIDQLRKVPARTRFLSIEPLLEDLGELDLGGIHWVIVGGESGSKARPMKASWARNVKRRCAERRVPFFFKQWGTWGQDGVRRSKRSNGRLLDGRLWEGFPAAAARGRPPGDQARG